MAQHIALSCAYNVIVCGPYSERGRVWHVEVGPVTKADERR
jgi:hypothetical protein